MPPSLGPSTTAPVSHGRMAKGKPNERCGCGSGKKFKKCCMNTHPPNTRNPAPPHVSNTPHDACGDDVAPAHARRRSCNPKSESPRDRGSAAAAGKEVLAVHRVSNTPASTDHAPLQSHSSLPLPMVVLVKARFAVPSAIVALIKTIVAASVKDGSFVGSTYVSTTPLVF